MKGGLWMGYIMGKGIYHFRGPNTGNTIDSMVYEGEFKGSQFNGKGILTTTGWDKTLVRLSTGALVDSLRYSYKTVYDGE